MKTTIVVNKTYHVSNKYKKSVIERNVMGDINGNTITSETGWRSGEFEITIKTEEERELLQNALDNEESLELNDFEEHEMYSTWDGCWEDFESDDTDLLEQLQEEYEANEEEYFGFQSFLEEEKGYDYEDCFFSIENGVRVEEIDSYENI